MDLLYFLFFTVYKSLLTFLYSALLPLLYTIGSLHQESIVRCPASCRHSLRTHSHCLPHQFAAIIRRRYRFLQNDSVSHFCKHLCFLVPHVRHEGHRCFCAKFITRQCRTPAHSCCGSSMFRFSMST